MKKLLLTIAFAAAAVAANAQFYAGGSIGLEFNSEDTPTALSGGTKSDFTLAPQVGYYINDKFDVGAELILGFGKDQADGKSTTFGLAPYVRYSFFQLGKFEVLGVGTIGFGLQSYKPDGGDKSTDTFFGIGAVPQLAYNLNDKIQLFADLNFASLNFMSYSPDQGDSFSTFNLGVDANNAFTTGALQVGFIYKF